MSVLTCSLRWYATQARLARDEGAHMDAERFLACARLIAGHLIGQGC